MIALLIEFSAVLLLFGWLWHRQTRERRRARRARRIEQRDFDFRA